jgi:hypothetical protein
MLLVCGDESRKVEARAKLSVATNAIVQSSSVFAEGVA